MKATYTPAIDAQLVQWHAEGLPIKEQARRLRVSTNNVNTWRGRLGLTRGYPPIPAELDAKILEWIEDGWPLSEVAETSGLSLAQLRRTYPQLQMDAATQGMLGAAVRNAVRVNPSVMKGLR